MTTDSFLAEGNLTDLGSVPSANVSFQYREEGDASWNMTANQTLSNETVFNYTVSGLDSNTTYEFRAYAENSSQSVSDTGTIMKRNTTMLKTVPGGTVSFSTDSMTLDTMEPQQGDTTLNLTVNVSGLGNVQEPVDLYFNYSKTGVSPDEKVFVDTIDSDGVYGEVVKNLSSNTDYEFYPHINGYTGPSETNSTTDYSFSTADITTDSNVGTDWLRFQAKFDDLDPLQDRVNDTIPINVSYREKGASSWNTLKLGKTDSNGRVSERVNGLQANTTYEFNVSTYVGSKQGAIKEVNTTMFKTVPGGTVGFSTSCSLNTENRVDDGAVLGLRGCGTFTVGSSGLYNGSGNLTVKAETLDVESGGEITAADLHVFTYGFDPADLESINAVGKGSNGGNGTVFLCSTVSSVSCRGMDDSGVDLNVSLNKTSDGLYRIRNITEDWSTGYLNWTENVSMTSKYDSDWGGAIEANYTIDNLAENLDFKVLKDGTVIDTENSGADGTINFSATLTSEHRFEVLESENPDWSNQAQEKNLVGLGKVNNLTSNLSDVGSGVSRLYLATNESGTWENRTDYTKQLPNIKSSTEVGVEWSSKAFDGEIADVSWRFYFKDAAGNRNSTDTKTFTVDGVKPDISNLNFKRYVDVDDGSASISFDVSDRVAGVKKVVLGENSTGSFQNSTLSDSSGYDYSLTRSNLGDVEFRIFGYDTVGNFEKLSGTVEFRNISVTENLNATSVNVSEPVNISGSVTVMPEGSAGSGTARLWVDTGGGYEKRSEKSVTGSYFFTPSFNVSGTHLVKVNFTSVNGISGLQTRKLNVSLNISDREAVFDSTGSSHVDVDAAGKTVNLTAFVSSSSDSEIDDVWADVEAPTGSERFYLENTSSLGSGQTWFHVVDVSQQFGSEMGWYNVTFAANTSRGIGSDYPETSFYVENITLSQDLSENRISTGENMTVSGEALLQPYSSKLSNTNISVWINGTFKRNISSNSSSFYSGEIKTPGEAGFYTLKVNASEGAVEGFNSTGFKVFNLTAEIESVSPDAVFRDEEDNSIDISFEDNVSAGIWNPGNLSGVSMSYEFPADWTALNQYSVLGDLEPGESGSNSPDIDVGPDAPLGKQTINATAVSDSGISDPANITVEVWTKSVARFQPHENVINRNNDYYSIYADVKDYVNGEALANISTEFVLVPPEGDSKTFVVESNSSGVAEFNWSVKNYSTGDYTIYLSPRDEPSMYINDSGTTSTDIRILGIMNLAGYSETNDSVYRVDNQENSSTVLTPTVENSQGELVDNATASFNISGTYFDCQISSGSCSVSYNPKDSLTPGIYTVQVNVTKKDFKTLRFNRSLEVRGVLSLKQDSTREIYTRGLEYRLNSTVTNGRGNHVNGDVSWILNGSKAADGEDTSWTVDPSVSRGVKTLEALTDRKYYDRGSDSRKIEVYGLAELGSLKPSTSTILPNTSIEVVATVEDANTSAEVEDMPVTFKVNGSVKTKVLTNSSGTASFTWKPENGVYNLTAHISDNSTINYNVSTSMLQSTVEIDAETYLESFSRTNTEMFRNDIKSKDSTTFKVDLSESSRTDSRVPAENVTVGFEVNDTESVNCTTDSTGYCEASYNPSTSVSVGNVSVEVSTNRTGWEQVDYSSNLVVKGLLSLTVEKPSSSILHRGKTVGLEVSTTSGGDEVDVPVNWSYRDSNIAEGKTADWSISSTKSLGSGVFKVKAGGTFYELTSVSSTKYIYGYSDVKFRQPDSGEIGYGETPTVKCGVENDLGLGISSYPVEFTQNGTVFASSKTGSEGIAKAEWNVPDKITVYEVGCRISDNSSLSYNASDRLDSRLFQTKDNVPPTVENLSISPDTVDPGDEVTIEFEAADKVGVDEAWVVIERPVGTETDKLFASEVSAGVYQLSYGGSGKLDDEGTYTVKAYSNDTSGNLGKELGSFAVDPGGSVQVSREFTVIESITQSSNSSFTVEANVTVNETAENVTLTSELGDSSKLDVNASKYVCGDLSKGDSCVRKFRVTVEKGATPGTEYVTFEAGWVHNGDSTSVSDFTEIVIERNPVLEVETGNLSDAIVHGKSKAFDFVANSTGNYRVESYTVSWLGGNLSSSWLSFVNSSESKLQTLETVATQANVSIPLGRSPGLYTADILFNSSNGGSEVRELDTTVPPGPSYEVRKVKDISAIKGAVGVLDRLEIDNTGNVNFTLKTYLSGNASELMNTDSVDSDKQEAANLSLEVAVDGGLPVGFYTATLTLNSSTPEFDVPEKKVDLRIDVMDFELGMKTSNSTVNASSGDYYKAEYNVTLGGEKLTQNLTHRVYVNATSAKVIEKTVSGGVFTVNFTIPEVPDARTHDLKVKVKDPSNDIAVDEVIKDKFTVPDVTEPQVNDIEVRDIELGGNTTLNVSASDNSLKGELKGVEKVKVNITAPNGTSYTSRLNVSGSIWQEELTNLSQEGYYKLEVVTEDPSGLETIETEYLHVAPKIQLKGSLETAGGEKVSADVAFVNPTTNETTTVNISGEYSIPVQTGTYNLGANFSGQSIAMKDVKVTRNLTNPFKAETLGDTSTSGLTPGAKARVMGIAVNTSFNPSSANITFNYTDYQDNIPSGVELSDMRVARCKDYDYQNRECKGDFQVYNLSEEDINTVQKTVRIEVPGFSVYTLFFPEKEDEKQQQTQQTQTSSGGEFPSGAFQDINESLQDIESQLNESESRYAEFGSSSVTARLKPGETKTVSLSVTNKFNRTQTFRFEAGPVVDDFVEDLETVTVPPQSSKDVIFKIKIPASELPNTYTGRINIESDKIDTKIPVNVAVLPPDKKLLDLSVDPVFRQVSQGSKLRVETSFVNQGYARNVDVTVKLTLVDKETNRTLSRVKRTIAVGTTLTKVFELPVPEDLKRGRYTVKGTARYSNLDVPMVATAVKPVRVATPFWQRNFFGMTYSSLGLGGLLVLVISLIGYGGYAYKRRKELEKKRYMENIDLGTIPSGGRGQGYIGEIAEMGKRTFIDLDDLTTHALIAGATGSGKTVTGQVMVEEALEQGKNVIVLDPTAQWTGFLRENEDEEMVRQLSDYGMSESDTRSFDGNIRAVEPGEDIDITPYLDADEEGNIIIFSLHRLDSKNIDEFVNNTIQQVFDANLPERDGLETVVVYDEVHRLLEKFGGEGQGLKQLERGAREFRKWGVGMVLLSQVISDFSGEIRANIGTTVQMRTQYDDDLDRVKNKFGIDTVKSIAKAEVGSGMLQNSDYNHGRPYFVDFRPLQHSPHRLSDEELDKYEEYNQRIDELEKKIDSMEEGGEDVYEYRNELKLARRNLKKGSFNLVETYLDELEEEL